MKPNKNNSHLFTGKYGENEAVNYLLGKDYLIIERNFRLKIGEIDIIAKDRDGSLCFVEVRTLNSDNIILPAETILKKKQAKIIRTATVYLQKHDLFDYPIRFDIIGVRMTNNKLIEIKHYESAFRPGE